MSDFFRSFTVCRPSSQTDLSSSLTVLTSNPPQYNYYCPHCDNQGYVLCGEVFYDTKATPISSPKYAPIEPCMVTSCLICGEPVSVSMWENHSKICDKCKKAILKLRKMTEDEEND